MIRPLRDTALTRKAMSLRAAVLLRRGSLNPGMGLLQSAKNAGFAMT
jgi:hypothetical protein